MADTTADNVAKAPTTNPEATAPEAEASLPPIAKAPVDTAEASMVPTAVPDGSNATTTVAPSLQAGAAAATEEASKTDTTNKDTKSEKPSEPAVTPVALPTTTPATTATVADAPALTNGDAIEAPKPVSVEEVHDQDLPDEKPPQATDKTNVALEKPVGSTNGAEAAGDDDGTSEKRKADDAPTANGDTVGDGAKGDAPAEKKQKTNGADSNGASKKPGRPKKEKKVPAPAPVGRTARKTRSQGAVE
ncbi:hypothetical protein F5Y15DRAFT_309348 [Xylariaceae sp. FL0016]|nr:hypothetical protein F5Y15DRAFT_309348 [Xylariaceae sp. FL0016]